MWCRSCGIETNEYKCPVCGKKTEEEIPVEIYWCDSCKTPIIKQISDSYKDKCPCCGRKTKYMAKDIRPVFPEERLLMELLMGKAPNTYADASVWATGSRYYIDGTVKVLSKKDFEKADIEQIAKDVVKYKELLTYDSFELYTERFINANRDRFNYLVDEASIRLREHGFDTNIRKFIYFYRRIYKGNKGVKNKMIKDIMKDPLFLAQKSTDATKADQQVVVDLLDTLRANLDHCVGMAANMIGVKKNIIVVAVGPFQFAMINPKITKKSGVFETAEGCLSLDGVRPCKRYKEIEVDYLDQDFNII